MKMTPQYFLFWLFCERFDHNTVDSLLYRVPISAIQLFYIKIEWISNCKSQIFIIISYIYMLSKNNNEILKSVRSASDDLTQIYRFLAFNLEFTVLVVRVFKKWKHPNFVWLYNHGVVF